MNITHEKATGNVQELCIEIHKADYAEKVETELKKYRRTAQIPGFRVGNAPMGMIKRNYEKPLIADEVNKMVGENLYGHFEKNNINVMFEPMLIDEKSTIDFENKEEFVFTFEFAVQPEFELDFAALPVMKAFKIEAGKEEIEDFMNQLRKRHGDYINPETIEDDDYVSVKWGEEENGFFFVKDLTEKGKDLFLGKKMDDVITVTFNELFTSDENLKKFLKKSDEYFDKTNLGNADVKIASIGRVNLAEMNDEFFKKAFPDGSITSIKELEKHAAQQIEIQWKQESDRKFMSDAITLLIKNIDMTLPEDFIKRFILKNNTEITEEKLSEEWNKYLESFKWQLIESKLGKSENIEVTIDEIKNHIRNYYHQNYFMQFNLSDVEENLNQLVEKAVKDQKQVKQLYDQLFDHKIMLVLQSKMNVEELSGDFNQFVAFMTGTDYVSTSTAGKKEKAERKKEKAELPSVSTDGEESNVGEEKSKKTRRSPAKKKI
jgi:trigger factor